LCAWGAHDILIFMAKKEKKRALITGITGQDGSYLAEHLVNEGYEVWGLMRRSSLEPMLRIEKLVRPPKIKIVYGNLRDSATLREALLQSKPHEIYNLAAQSDVWVSFKTPDETMEINYFGLGRLVEEAIKLNPKVRIYQASTSEMFGKTKPPQNESSEFQPVSPYGEAKLLAHRNYVEGYREKYNLYICGGVLFNHESPRRGEHFVTRKITISLAKVKLGLQDSFALGNLDARRDWGFAGDYVKAMHKMLQQKKPEDFVIATGQAHTVREFVEAAAEALDMPITWSGKGLKEVGKTKEGKTVVTVSKEYYRPNEVHHLLGDSRKAQKKLGWKIETTFKKLAAMMAKADYERLKKMKDAGLI
jgi:GDPmannose 4,6-dehydratase